MKMSAKKVMSLALAGLLSVSLMACSGSGSAAETQAEAEAAGDHELALHYYESYMTLNDRNPQIIYNMAMIYQAMGDEDTADQLFGQVIMNFADSELAAQAQAQRGY